MHRYHISNPNRVMVYKDDKGKLYPFRNMIDGNAKKVPARRAPDGKLFTNKDLAKEYMNILYKKSKVNKLEKQLNDLEKTLKSFKSASSLFRYRVPAISQLIKESSEKLKKLEMV